MNYHDVWYLSISADETTYVLPLYNISENIDPLNSYEWLAFSCVYSQRAWQALVSVQNIRASFTETHLSEKNVYSHNFTGRLGAVTMQGNPGEVIIISFDVLIINKPTLSIKKIGFLKRRTLVKRLRSGVFVERRKSNADGIHWIH